MDTPTLAYVSAAALIGCLADDLLAFRWAEDEEQFIVLGPDGRKHRFDRDQLEQAMAPMIDDTEKDIAILLPPKRIRPATITVHEP